MQSHQLKFSKTAHYYTIGTASPQVEHLWICCHGYGQAANRFIYKFKEIENENTFVVAPEGLSRFYFGQTRHVGASWMTKSDRLVEIEDYCNWLDTIYDHFVPQMSANVKITFFGFSQGVATIFRWMHARKRPCDHIIAWAGMVPEDISYLEMTDYFDTKKIIRVIGTADEFLTPERLQSDNDLIESQKIKAELVRFEGKHVVDRATLREVADWVLG
jgi:predicted esterase